MIAGTVWLDANANGIHDPGEEPLADVTMLLEDGAGAILRSMQTMPTGMYLFVDLFPGDYVVRQEPLAGYLTTTGRIVSVTLTSDAMQVVDFGNAPAVPLFLPLIGRLGSSPG